MAGKTAGYRYCRAHTVFSANGSENAMARVRAVWDHQSSDLFTPAERAALDFAVSAASIPNDVTDLQFALLRDHWDDGQIVEILAVVALYGFLNRWNDSLATQLEQPSRTTAVELLGPIGWEPGKHR